MLDFCLLIDLNPCLTQVVLQDFRFASTSIKYPVSSIRSYASNAIGGEASLIFQRKTVTCMNGIKDVLHLLSISDYFRFGYGVQDLIIWSLR